MTETQKRKIWEKDMAKLWGASNIKIEEGYEKEYEDFCKFQTRLIELSEQPNNLTNYECSVLKESIHVATALFAAFGEGMGEAYSRELGGV